MKVTVFNVDVERENVNPSCAKCMEAGNSERINSIEKVNSQSFQDVTPHIAFFDIVKL